MGRGRHLKQTVENRDRPAMINLDLRAGPKLFAVADSAGIRVPDLRKKDRVADGKCCVLFDAGL